jgi:flagellar hook-associated protein 1 FlgK
MSSDLLSIGASGLRAYKAALGAVSDNIANAQTVGYARRSARMNEVSAGSGASILYRNVDRFDGVEVQAVDRATDQFRVGEARLANSANAKAAAVAQWMIVTESAVADGESGVGAAIAKVFAAGSAMSADPAARQPRTAFLGAIDEAAQAIRVSAGDLQRAASGVATQARSAVESINSALAAIAALNLAIKHTGPGSATFVELSDQRDALIDRVSGQVNVDIVIGSDGTTILSNNGQPLLAGGTAATVAFTYAVDGLFTFSTNGTVLAPTAGSLAGLTNAASTIANRREALDHLANDFSVALNQWQADGRTAVGAPGSALLSATGGALALTSLPLNPDDVAAGSAGGVPNGNTLDLAVVRASSGAEVQWNNLVSTQAQATAAAGTQLATTNARLSAANGARDGVEGVDLDHEAADLLRYQQAYEGSARVVQMARDILNTIMGLFK